MADFEIVQAGIEILVIGAILGGALGAAAAYFLAPKPKGFGEEAKGRSGNVRSAESPQHVVYGFATKGGTLFYINGSGQDNEYLHEMLVLAGHQCFGIGRVYFNAEQAEDFPVVVDLPPENKGEYLPVYLADLRESFVRDKGTALDAASRIRGYLGSSGQPADTFAVEENENWSVDHRARGHCYIYARLAYDPELFSSFIPNITAEVFGKRDILDPRDNQRRWTMNPALIIGDILETYLGVERTNIDSDALIEAANFCDEEILRKDNSPEPRYTANGYFELDGDWEKWLTPFINAMAGAVVEWGGVYHIHAGAWRAPELTITDNDFMGPFSRKISDSDRERSNAAKGTFVGPQTFDEPTEFPVVKDVVAIGEDGGRVNWLELDLEMVNTHTQAQRVANILLQESRRDETISIEVPLLIGLDLKPWDNVILQSDIFGIEDTYRVVDHRTTPGVPINIELVLKRHDPEVYDWNPATQEQDLQNSRTNLPGVGDASRPTAATFSVAPIFDDPDHRAATVDFNWTEPVEAFEAIEIEISGRVECRTASQPGDPGADPPVDPIAAGSWSVVTIDEAREVLPGIETITFDIEDETKTSGPYDFRSHSITKVRMRARLSAGVFGPWIVPAVK